MLVCLFLLCVERCWSDTPANCTYEDLVGTWVFQVSKGGHDKTVNCSAEGKKQTKKAHHIKKKNQTNGHTIWGSHEEEIKWLAFWKSCDSLMIRHVLSSRKLYFG